jgi:5-methylcytosine-specific restriction endonuclease McrA
MFNLLYNICKTTYAYFFPTPKRKAIPAKTRQLVWQKYNHGDIGKCYACNRQIDIDNFHCAHLISHKHGGKATVENLFATCAHCNLSCNKKHLYQFIKEKKFKSLGAKHAALYYNT